MNMSSILPLNAGKKLFCIGTSPFLNYKNNSKIFEIDITNLTDNGYVPYKVFYKHYRSFITGLNKNTNKPFIAAAGLNTNRQLGIPNKKIVENYEIIQHGDIFEFVNNGIADFCENIHYIWHLALGSNHSIIYLPHTRDAFFAGLNNYGQFGSNLDKQKDWTRMQLPFCEVNENVNQVSFDNLYGGKENLISKITSGLDHTLLLNSEGVVYSSGLNTDSQLGIPNTNDKFVYDTWQKVSFSEDGYTEIIDIASGYDFNFAQDEQCSWYSWGNNEEDQCLHSDLKDKDKIEKPKLVVNQNLHTVKLTGSFGVAMDYSKNCNLVSFGYCDFLKSQKNTIFSNFKEINEDNANLNILGYLCPDKTMSKSAIHDLASYDIDLDSMFFYISDKQLNKENCFHLFAPFLTNKYTKTSLNKNIVDASISRSGCLILTE